MADKVAECYITQTKNNIFVVFLKEGKVLYERSGGKLGYKGAGKRTRLVAELLGQEVGKKVLDCSYKEVKLYLKGGVTALTRGVISGLVRSGLIVQEMHFLRVIAHNGVRPRKQRRV